MIRAHRQQQSQEQHPATPEHHEAQHAPQDNHRKGALRRAQERAGGALPPVES